MFTGSKSYLYQIDWDWILHIISSACRSKCIHRRKSFGDCEAIITLTMFMPQQCNCWMWRFFSNFWNMPQMLFNALQFCPHIFPIFYKCFAHWFSCRTPSECCPHSPGLPQIPFLHRQSPGQSSKCVLLFNQSPLCACQTQSRWTLPAFE